MAPQAMPQQQRALPAKHARFVRNAYDRFGVLQRGRKPLLAGKHPYRRLEGRWKMSIGVGIFLMVLGAILAFAVEATTPGINVHTLGIILLLTGLIAVLYSLLFWSNLSPWGRRRTVARRRTVVEERPVQVVEERPIEVIEERPVEVIEERRLDDGLP
jgi:hypothetical protein